MRLFGLLIRHFFGRLFDNEIVSQTGDMRTNAVQALGLAAGPGMFVAFYMLPERLRFDQPLARNWLLVDNCYFFVLYSMAVMGLVVIFEWDALFPDRTDYIILTPLPLRGLVVFAAKLLSLLGFLGLFASGANAFDTMLVPLIAGGSRPAAVLSAHATAVIAAGLFAALFLAVVQGVFLNVLPARAFRRISPWVQMSAMVLLSAMVFLTPLTIALIRPSVESHSPLLGWLPPLWFLGLYLDLLPGHPAGPVFHELAQRALGSLWILSAAFAIVYSTGYLRHSRRILESVETAGKGPGRLRLGFEAWLNRWLLPDPLERATFHFISQTILRSPRHRLFLAALAGIGLALTGMGSVRITIEGGAAFPSFAVYSFSAVALTLSFFLITGLRAVFQIPAELRANWVFRASESHTPAPHLRAARKWVTIMGLAPLLGMLLPLEVVFQGWRIAIIHLSFAAVVALVLLDVLMFSFRKIPFTCSYFPGKTSMALLAGAYALGFTAYCWSMAEWEDKLIQRPHELILFYAGAVLIWLGLNDLGKRKSDRDRTLIYEDQPDPAVQTLGIG